MRALARSARERILDEPPLEDRLDHPDDGVMYDTVPEGSRGHQTFLGLVNAKVMIAPVFVHPRDKLIVERDQLVFDLAQKGRPRKPAALAA